MLLPQTKEREYRFKLALRMGLPIFGLLLALVLHTFVDNYATLNSSFYVESLILLVFSIYFFLYLIYRGFEVKITDNVSKTFTREYLLRYIKQEMQKNKEYTLVLISIDNLDDINKLYGIQNGDKVLAKTAEWISSYLSAQNIEGYPLGHIKGGDFILGLPSSQTQYSTVLELMCLKVNELSIDDIEIQLSGSISDTSYSKELHYLIEDLYVKKEQRVLSREEEKEDSLEPNKLESAVINAIENRALTIMTQDVFSGGTKSFVECFVRLKRENSQPLFAKTYMKIINKLGLGVAYDLMVLEELLLNVGLKEQMYALRIASTSLRNEKFLQKAKELLRDSDKKLLFILSEHEYYSHTSRFNAILKQLKQLGVSFAIDRVGSLHTSFLYLRELDIDFIRFDSYYSHPLKLKENRAVLQGFELIAREKSIKTWIKNIEDKESLSIIDSLDIDYKQGKFLSNLDMIYDN